MGMGWTVSLSLVHVCVFGFLALLCLAILAGLRNQSALGWLAGALLIGAIEIFLLGLFKGTVWALIAATVMVPLAYLSVGQASRIIAGQSEQWPRLILAVLGLTALSVVLIARDAPFIVQTVPFQLAGALAVGESVVRLRRSAGRTLVDLALTICLGAIAAIFLIRIPAYPALFGFWADYAAIAASKFEKLTLLASALLAPPTVCLMLAKIIGGVIETYRTRAERDGLTGLLNRTAFDNAAEVARKRGGAVILCDIDHFKSVNDTYGHHTGDAVIRAFATMLARTRLRAGRLGGEEFGLLLPGRNAAEAARVAEALRHCFAESLLPGIPAGKRLTASFGISGFVAGELPAEAFARADKALYEAKALGRDRVAISVENDLIVEPVVRSRRVA